MIGWIIAGVLGLGAVCSVSSAEERSKYMDGENFKTVSNSELLTVTDDGNKRYVYLRFKEEKIR